MFKVVKSRKANKIAYLLVLVTMLTSLAATPMKAYAVEVGDVLYEEKGYYQFYCAGYFVCFCNLFVY